MPAISGVVDSLAKLPTGRCLPASLPGRTSPRTIRTAE